LLTNRPVRPLHMQWPEYSHREQAHSYRFSGGIWVVVQPGRLDFVVFV